MRLKVVHDEEKKGVLFKKLVYVIRFSVELSEDERNTIKRFDWGSQEAIAYQCFGRTMVDTVDMLLRPGNSRSFESGEDRAAYQGSLVEEMQKLSRALGTPYVFGDLDLASPKAFSDDSGVRVIVDKRIINQTAQILNVARYDDRTPWQFITDEHPGDHATLVELGEVIALDPSVLDLADLPVGWRAWRTTQGSNWQRTPLELET